MAFNVISKSDSIIKGTTSQKTKISGNSNELDVKAKNDLWIAGDENEGDVRLSGAGRLAVTGEDNDLSTVDASNATKGSVYLNGSGNRIGTYTGSSGNNDVSIRGTNNSLNKAIFGGGADRLTSIGGTITNAELGSGDDFVGIKDARDKFTLNGGNGTDKLWLDKLDDSVDGSAISNFEKLYLKDYDSNYKVEKGADGKYTLSNGSNKLALGSNDMDIWDGTKYTKASVLAGATGATGGTGSTGATGSLPAATEYADNLLLEAKDYGGATLDLLAGNDKLHIKNGVNNVNIKGGLGLGDEVQLEQNIDDYDNIAFANGKFTFKDAAGKTFTIDESVEKYAFGNDAAIDVAALKARISPLVADANGVFSPTGTASKYNKDIAPTATQSVNLAANATGYNLTGAGKIDLTAYNLAALQGANGLSYTASGGNYTNVMLNGNNLNNTGAIRHNGIDYASLKLFIDWFKTQ